MSRDELIVFARRQEGQIARLATEVAELSDRNAELAAQNAELAERLARLERLISRNSGNSGMSPSGDDQPGKPRPKDKPARRGKAGGKRKPGKQPGAEGRHLAWSADPDDRVPHFPQGACGCGVDLALGYDLGVQASHQVHDIPPVSASVVQHDLHAVECGCGKVHTAPRPEGVSSAPVSFGLGLQSLCVYLMVMHAIPVHRCVELIESLTGARPSAGFVHGMIARSAAAVEQANLRIRALLTLAYAVCCDETPLRVGPKKAKKYLLVACTRLLTWYMLGDRTMETFKDFVLADLTGVVVHDRYQNYDSAEVGEHLHQLCAAHLIRDLEDCVEAYPDAVWPVQIQRTLRGLIHAANTARDQDAETIDPAVKDELISLFRHGVRVGLSEVRRVPGPAKTVKQPLGRVLLEVLRDREDDVLRFARDLRVPPTNNQAERDVRPAKTQQKISGRLRSERATENRYAIRGYLSTVVKHGADVITAIRDALLGRAWMPPAPA
jgi:transposase